MNTTDSAHEISFDTVRELARCYRTNLTATALRLIDLGSVPSTTAQDLEQGKRSATSMT